MKVLNIGTDKNLFEENSEVRKRMIDYGDMVHELHIIVFSKRKSLILNPKSQISNNIFVYPTNSKNKLFYIFDAYKIGKKIVRNCLSAGEAGKLEIRNSHDKFLITSQDPFETGLVGWLIKRKFRLPLQLQVHTDFLSLYFWNESLLNKIRVLLAKFLVPRADGIRAVSQRIKNSLLQVSSFNPERSGQASKINVLPIYVDIEEIKKTPITESLRDKYSQFDFIILMASRLSKEKNIGLAIHALYDANLRMRANNMNNANKKNIGLIIVGDGPEREALKFRVSGFKLRENVVFEKWADFKTLISYYKTADLFLLTSNYEGYGMTILEAMAAGCPVLMTDVGIANEILINKKDGFVVPVGNKQELTKALLDLIADRELRKNFTVNSDKIVNFRPSYEEYLRNYYNSWMSCAKK